MLKWNSRNNEHAWHIKIFCKVFVLEFGRLILKDCLAITHVQIEYEQYLQSATCLHIIHKLNFIGDTQLPSMANMKCYMHFVAVVHRFIMSHIPFTWQTAKLCAY